MRVKDIESAVKYIALKFTGIEGLRALVNFANMTEEQAMAKAHHGLGRTLRNEMELWGKNNITEYFKRLGISHADDMSGILVTCFHRKLNDKPYGLDGQVEEYKKYWAEEAEKESADKLKA